MQSKRATIMRARCAGSRAARTFLLPSLLHALEGMHRRDGAQEQVVDPIARRARGSILVPWALTGRISASRGPCPWPRRQHAAPSSVTGVSDTQRGYEG